MAHGAVDGGPPPSELIGVLAEIVGVPSLPDDVRLAELGIDSLDVLEWLYELEERLGVEFDTYLDESTELTVLGELTLSELVSALVALRGKPARGPA